MILKNRAPSPYDAFVLRAWKAAQRTGVTQYLLVEKDAGTQTEDPTFSLSLACVPEHPRFSSTGSAFCDLGDLPVRLSKTNFLSLMKILLPQLTINSTIVFTYCADAYPYRHMEQLLSSCGCLIYEHLDEVEIEDQFLPELIKSHPRHSIRRRCFCLAVKHRNI